MTQQKKWCIVTAYFEQLTPGKAKLANGDLDLLSYQLNVGKKTISRIVSEYRKLARIHGRMNVNLSPKKVGRVGRKSTMTPADKRKLHRANTLTKGNASLRTLANRTGLGLSKVFREMKKSMVTYETKWIKPKLSDDHRKARIKHITDLKDMEKTWEFKEQKNVIVVDEAWFYLCKDRTFARVYPGEEPPASVKVQHKKHVPKIMFLTALARPDPAHGFDGKIGIWRVQETVVCQRGNRYHRAGEEYLRDCNMDAELYRHFMKEIFAAIKVKMPWLQGREVIVQQDGASPHTGNGNVDYFNRYFQRDGWNFKVITQPAQSPDLNINDLAFFRSLKCRVEQLKNDRLTLDSLYQAIQRAWRDYDAATLERIWGVQYACYRKVLELEGDNDYQPPHSGVRKGGGKIDFHIDEEIFRKAKRWAARH